MPVKTRRQLQKEQECALQLTTLSQHSGNGEKNEVNQAEIEQESKAKKLAIKQSTIICSRRVDNTTVDKPSDVFTTYRRKCPAKDKQQKICYDFKMILKVH